MTSVEEISAGEGITVIEEHMLDRQKFYPFIVANGLMMRTVIHPFNFVRVRQQVQKSRSMYKGTFDAFSKITKNEGLWAFRKGGMLNYIQIIPSFIYVNILENTKSQLKKKTQIKNSVVIEFLGGGTASLISSVISLPLDIAYQHLIIDGQVSPEKDSASSKRIFIPAEAKERRFGALRYIYRYIYEKEGLMGFWKGSSVSIAFYSFNSGLWWTFYSLYRDQGVKLLPDTVPILLIQACSGAFAGHTGALLTNWIDVIRVRVQTEVSSKSTEEKGSRKGNKIIETAKKLWAEEGYKFMLKGLTARLMATSIISPLLIGGYEFVKRISLKNEYKSAIRR